MRPDSVGGRDVRSEQRGSGLLEDHLLASAAARGDESAFSSLVERYRSYIYTIAYRILLHEDDALDAAQTVFLRLVEKIGDFNGRGPFRRWLAAIAVREALTFRDRRRPREQPMDPVDLSREQDRRQAGGNPASGSNSARSPLESAARNERRVRVEAAIARLSPQQRAIFVLRFREDLGPSEIAAQLDLPSAHVRVQLSRALARLREILGEDC